MPTQQHMPQLAVALDVPEKQRALALASQLRGTVPWCKVGMELFTHVGPGLLEELSAMGFSVFLDLKFYDIPNTVAQAVKAAAAVGVNMLTLHCQGGERMCRAAAEAAAEAAAGISGARPLLFGVTVLTSFAPGEMPGITAQPILADEDTIPDSLLHTRWPVQRTQPISTGDLYQSPLDLQRPDNMKYEVEYNDTLGRYINGNKLGGAWL
mgnify:CR=1 FL=1